MQAEKSLPGARDILDEMAQNHEVDSTLADEAEISADQIETVTIEVIETIEATERAQSKTLPASEYREQTRKRTRLENRHGEAPSGHLNKTVPFIRHGDSLESCPDCSGSTRVTCPDCKGSKTEPCQDCAGVGIVDCEPCEGGDVDCSGCNGSGQTAFYIENQCPRCKGRSSIDCPNCPGGDDDCRTCRGKGVKSCPKCSGNGMVKQRRTKTCSDCGGSGTEDCDVCSGSGSVPCDPCGGAGEVDCSNCRGVGDVGCEFCDEDGQVAETVIGTLKFTAETSVETDSDLPLGDRIEASDGELVETETPVDRSFPDRNRSTTFRERIERRTVPVRFVSYEHNGIAYDVVHVDGENRYTDSPTSGSFLNNEIDQWRREERFKPEDTSGPIRKFLSGYLSIGVGLLQGLVLAGIAILATMFVVGASDAVRQGATIGAFGLLWVIYTAYRTSSDESESTASVLTWVNYLAPIGVYGSVGGWLLINDVSPWIQLSVVTLAATHWVAVCMDGVASEGERIEHAQEIRREFIGKYGPEGQLRSKGVLDRLPDSDATPGEGAFAGLHRAVKSIFWVPLVYYFALVLLSGIESGFPVLTLLSPLQATAIPLAIAALATVSLLSLPVRWVSTSL